MFYIFLNFYAISILVLKIFFLVLWRFTFGQSFLKQPETSINIFLNLCKVETHCHIPVCAMNFDDSTEFRKRNVELQCHSKLSWSPSRVNFMIMRPKIAPRLSHKMSVEIFELEDQDCPKLLPMIDYCACILRACQCFLSKSSIFLFCQRLIDRTNTDRDKRERKKRRERNKERQTEREREREREREDE